jgi:hypothetical protein
MEFLSTAINISDAEYRIPLSKKEREHNTIHLYTVDQALKKAGKWGRSILENDIIAVDFSQSPFFRDPNEARWCVVATTSNGQLGTLSHLTIDIDIENYAEMLLKYHIEPTSVCLSGGWDGESETLLDDLYIELQKRGFKMTSSPENNEVGSILRNRTATLYPDRVHIWQHNGRQASESDFPREVTLTFPQSGLNL